MAIVDDDYGHNNLDIKVLSAPAPVTWNMSDALKWAQDYAAVWKGKTVTDENLPVMKDVDADLGRKIKRLDEIRLEQKRAYLVPLDKFEAEIKQVIAAIAEVRTPIQTQIKVYTDKRREEKRAEAIGIIQELLQASALREKFWPLVTVDDSWTLLGAKRNQVKSEVQHKIDGLLKNQEAEDAAEEAKQQRAELIEGMLQNSTEAFQLSTPLSAKAVIIPDTATLAEISSIIMTAGAKQQQAEAAAVKRSEENRQADIQRAEQRKADGEAAAIKSADIAAANLAIQKLATPDIPFAPKQYKMNLNVYGTKESLDMLTTILDQNGWNHAVLSREEVK